MATSYILLENGTDKLLLESGYILVLEDHQPAQGFPRSSGGASKAVDGRGGSKVVISPGPSKVG